MKTSMSEREFVPPLDLDDPPIYLSRQLTPSVPALQRAVEWIERSSAATGRIERADFRPADLGNLLRYTSLFDLIFDETGRLIDLYTRVFSTTMCEIYGELTGRRTSEALPPIVQRRFLHHAGSMAEAGVPLFSKTHVRFKDKVYIDAEGILVPLYRNGRIAQCLNLFSFR